MNIRFIMLDEYFVSAETEQEFNVISCCLSATEEENETSDSEVIEDEIDLEELSGNYLFFVVR